MTVSPFILPAERVAIFTLTTDVLHIQDFPPNERTDRGSQTRIPGARHIPKQACTGRQGVVGTVANEGNTPRLWPTVAMRVTALMLPECLVFLENLDS